MKPRGQIISTVALSMRDNSLKIKEFFSNIIFSIKSKFSRIGLRRNSNPVAFDASAKRRDLKKFLPYLIVGIAVLAGLAILSSLGYLAFKNINTDGKVSILKPKASQVINEEFLFPLFGEDGTEVTKFKYVIEKAELRDEIIVNGGRTRSVSGRTFLVLNVKLSNDYNLPMKINSRDYIRLIVDGNTADPFAADAYSDPIEVQPISAEQTILGFAINDDSKNLVLRVGEINGEKREITLSLK